MLPWQHKFKKYYLECYNSYIIEIEFTFSETGIHHTRHFGSISLSLSIVRSNRPLRKTGRSCRNVRCFLFQFGGGKFNLFMMNPEPSNIKVCHHSNVKTCTYMQVWGPWHSAMLYLATKIITYQQQKYILVTSNIQTLVGHQYN